MNKENIQKLFKKIGQMEVEYFSSDYCVCLTRQKIKEHVDRQIKERLINASISQKNTNFIIALIYDAGANDNITQQKRVLFRNDLINKLRFDNISEQLKPFKCRDQDRKLNEIKRFLNVNKIGSIKTYLDNNNTGDIRNNIYNIYGVGEKLKDWSITNVTGKELVIDIHIARVLLRTGLAESINTDEHPWKSVIFGNKNMPSNKYSLLKEKFQNQIDEVDILSEYCGFKEFMATQYLWFFGKNVCTKTQPMCEECILNKLCKSSLTRARKIH